MSLAFDRSEWFGFDKAAEVPCPLLRRENTCAIFSRLAAEGHAGCANFDCYGAGRVSELFGGRSWRDDPDRARIMFSAFRRLKDVHELQLLLHEAARLDLPEAYASRVRQLLAVLEPEPPLTLDGLDGLDLRARSAEVHALLRELRPFAAHRRLPLLR